jgi:hypothetical protein
VVYSGVSSLLSIKDGNPNGRIILDSGATDHMTGRTDWFEGLKPLESPVDVYIADGSVIRAVGRGSIRLVVYNGFEWTPIKWEGVLYVPELGTTSLMSCTQLVRKGYRNVMERHNWMYHDRIHTKSRDVEVPLKNGQYELVSRNKVGLPQGMTAKAASMDVCHKRLGHVSSQTIKTMVKNELMKDLKVNNWTGSDCDGCHFGKQTCNHHTTKLEKRDLKAGEALHTDLCDIGHRAWNKSRYLVTFKCEATGYSLPYFVEDKTQVMECIRHVLNRVKLETGNCTKIIRSDNGTEYVNSSVRELLETQGVIHERSPPEVKQCTGRAERENRTLMDGARALLYDAALSDKTWRLLWPEAVSTAAYLRNRVPSQRVQDTTPYEQWYGDKPRGDHLRIFGSVAYVHVPENQRRKLDPKARRMIFVGYDWKTTKL